MNIQPAEDQFRVTSIPYQSTKQVIFTGVPIQRGSYRINSGKYVITVKAAPEALAILPSKGQHWVVQGDRKFNLREIDGYSIKQHTYESPKHLECRLPDTGEQFIKFIAKEKEFKGIGESKARALWERFGKDLHPMLRGDSITNRKRLSALLSDDSIEALYNGYAKYKNLAYCNWMSERKIPASVQQRLLKHHDQQSIEAILANPYLLLGFGMTFDRIDALAQRQFEILADDPRRLSAAMESALRKEIEQGHTYTSQSYLRPHLRRLLQLQELVEQAITVGHNKAQYIFNPQLITYHPTAQLLMESVIARRLLKLAASHDLYDEQANEAYCLAASDLPYQLLPQQSEAIQVTLDNAVSCITGGAGTGKTTVLRTALKAFHHLQYQVHAVALSGRAAMRLHESIGFPTKTIAAFLRQDAIEPSPQQPRLVLVIDEASMLDIPTMYRIVTHLHPSVRLVLSGDPDQLPPIGCGKVLADVVDSKAIANTKLEVVKRQEGSTGIPEYANMINAGQVPESLSMGATTFYETKREQIPEVCTQLFNAHPNGSCIMAATKAMVGDINKRVQQAVNADGQRLQFNINGEQYFLDLRQDDTVLFTQNNYEKGVQNGTLGALESVEIQNESYGSVVLDTGTKIEINQALLDSIQLGYSITLHKAQGSQFPRIIIALQKGKIVDRAWLYTAITRAEAEVHIVGAAADFKLITEAPSHSHRRRSHLLNVLRQSFN